MVRVKNCIYESPRKDRITMVCEREIERERVLVSAILFSEILRFNFQAHYFNTVVTVFTSRWQ